MRTPPVRSNFTVFQQLRRQRPKLGTTEEKLPVGSTSSNGLRMRVFMTVTRPFPWARQEFGTSIAPCRVGSLAAVQQRWVHGHFTWRTLIFRLKGRLKKIGQLVRSTKAELVRCNISYFIFPQWGAVSSDRLQKEEKKERRENLNSKTLFYKDCSLGSVKKRSNY